MDNVHYNLISCFRRLNEELEAKTANLVREAEEVMVGVNKTFTRL